MRPSRLAWLAPVVVVAGGLARPAAADARWHLDFTHDRPRYITVDAPGGEARSYWYLLYTLKNPGEQPVTTRTDIRVFSDTPYTYRDGFEPLVQAEIEKRHRKKLLGTLDVRRTEIAPGQGVECVAIFSLHQGEDLRLLFQAMNAFRVRDDKGGVEKLKDALARYPEGPSNAWVRELLKAAEGGGLEAAREKTEELATRWNGEKRGLVPTADAVAEAPPAPAEGEEGGTPGWTRSNVPLAPDLRLLADAVHLCRTRDLPGAIEKLVKLLTDFPQSRFRRTADQLRVLAVGKRVEELDRAIDAYLRGPDPQRHKEEADRIEFHVGGLWDVIAPDADAVYVETKILKIVYEKPGDELYPTFDAFRQVGPPTWYVEEGSRKFLRKLFEPRSKK